MLNEYLDNQVSVSVSAFDCLEKTRLVKSTKLRVDAYEGGVTSSPLVINNIPSQLGDKGIQCSACPCKGGARLHIPHLVLGNLLQPQGYSRPRTIRTVDVCRNPTGCRRIQVIHTGVSRENWIVLNAVGWDNLKAVSLRVGPLRFDNRKLE